MPPVREANWIDGLRGVASFMVVCGHLCTAFVPHLHAPATSETGEHTLFQLPFLRLCVGGRSAVALFFLITGYVNSIGPIAKSRAGNVDAAFAGVARSALARSGRLVLPTMIATLFSWVLSQLNAYTMAEHIDSTWIRQGFHAAEPSLWTAIRSLLRAEIQTWTIGWDEYDGTQWTLILFLEGSFVVYMTMVSTIMVTPKARKLIFAVIYIYAWLSEPSPNHPSIKTMNIVIGMLVAELHNELGQSATSLLPAPIPAFLIATGLFLCCYPQEAPEWAPWSKTMLDIMTPLVPHEADVRRYWDSLGASIVLLGIFFSSTARKLLTTPTFNFLGRVSFPVYLLHNQLMKSVLTWMIYFPSAMNPQVDEEGNRKDLERGTPLHMFIAIAIFYYILYRLAALWVRFVDPFCGRIVKAATSWASGEGQSDKTGLLT